MKKRADFQHTINFNVNQLIFISAIQKSVFN